MIDLLTEFPELPRTVLRDIKKTVDLGFKDFSRAYGESIEGFFYPLLKLLVFIEDILIATPWPIIIGIVAGLGYWATRSYKLVMGCHCCLICCWFIWYVGRYHGNFWYHYCLYIGFNSYWYSFRYPNV